jgi:citrate synthase
MAWLTASEALALLDVQPQTLYANVSRGRIRAKPDPEDPRRSLYHKGDVTRAAEKRVGRRSAASVAQAAIGWSGEPVLETRLSAVEQGRHWYRGQDALALAETNGLEEIATLLWDSGPVSFAVGEAPADGAMPALARRAERDPPSLGRPREALLREAAELVGLVAAATLGPTAPGPMHRRLAQAWNAPEAEDLLRRALVLMADHELNSSTFACRVAASTGAPLSACLLAGLATLSGPRHGGASLGMRLLTAAAGQMGAEEAVRNWLAQGQRVPAFGHPLYAEGDPRAIALLARFEPDPLYPALRDAAEELTGEKPNIDFALAALADRFDLPPTASFSLFAIARSVGWIAHTLEQSAGGRMIRPRARYVGPALIE